jgi:hypothetical protein
VSVDKLVTGAGNLATLRCFIQKIIVAYSFSAISYDR